MKNAERGLSIKAIALGEFYQARGLRLESSREDVIRMNRGDPDFPTPQHIIEAAYSALKKGLTHYTRDRGRLELRQVLSEKLEATNHIAFDPETEIIITVGASAATTSAILATVDKGDEVIVISPYYFAYIPQVMVAGGIPIPITLDEKQDFALNPEDVENAITNKTKAIIIQSPNNPSGRAYDKACLEAIAEIVQTHDLVVVSDEVYNEFLFDGSTFNSISSTQGMKERTIITGGPSKYYAMCGWRVGFAAGCENTISRLIRVHYTLNLSASSFGQMGALAAYTGPQGCAKEMLKEYDKRRHILVEGLNRIPGFKCHYPMGCHSVFPNIRGTGMSPMELSKYLAREAGVITTPGNAFGPAGEGHIRMAFTTVSTERLRTAVKRIQEAMEKTSSL